jgi:hypothetical protein
MDWNYDHQMSLSKSKCWYSRNCLHFLKRAVPLPELILELFMNYFLFKATFVLLTSLIYASLKRITDLLQTS